MNDTNPLTVILVKNGSRGDKLLFLYPFAKETGKDSQPEGKRLNHYAVPVREDLQQARSSSTNIEDGRLVGFSNKALSNLFAVKTHLCGKKFELKVNDVRFVGHPTHLQSGLVQASKAQPSSIILFNIVFALRATASHSVVRCYHDLSLRLGVALRHEERRCGYLSKEAKMMLFDHDELHDEADFKNSAFDNILSKCQLARELKTVYESLCSTGIVEIYINNWVGVSFCLTQKVHSLSSPNLAVEPEALQKIFKALRPYHAVLLLVEEEELLSSLSPDSSPTLRRLIKAVNPMKSLQQLAADTDLPIAHVLDLVNHMVYWAKATVIYPLCESNVYIVSPHAPTQVSSSLVERFTERFPKASLLDMMSDFSFPNPLSRETLSQDDRQTPLVQAVVWMLQHRLLMQLHTYVYLVPSPPGSDGSKLSNGSSVSLSRQLQSMHLDDGSASGPTHSDTDEASGEKPFRYSTGRGNAAWEVGEMTEKLVTDAVALTRMPTLVSVDRARWLGGYAVRMAFGRPGFETRIGRLDCAFRGFPVLSDPELHQRLEVKRSCIETLLSILLFRSVQQRVQPGLRQEQRLLHVRRSQPSEGLRRLPAQRPGSRGTGEHPEGAGGQRSGQLEALRQAVSVFPRALSPGRHHVPRKRPPKSNPLVDRQVQRRLDHVSARRHRRRHVLPRHQELSIPDAEPRPGAVKKTSFLAARSPNQTRLSPHFAFF